MKKLLTLLALLPIFAYSQQNIVSKTLTFNPLPTYVESPEDSNFLFLSKITGRTFRTSLKSYVKTSGGTQNFMVRWIDNRTIGNSSILYDNGTNAGATSTFLAPAMKSGSSPHYYSFRIDGNNGLGEVFSDGSSIQRLLLANYHYIMSSYTPQNGMWVGVYPGAFMVFKKDGRLFYNTLTGSGQKHTFGGSGRFTDTLFGLTMSDLLDSSDIVATTAWVKKQKYYTGTGGVNDITATNNTGQTWTITGTNTKNLSLTLTKDAVGLGNVDNTSDVTKNTATATLTNKTLTNPASTVQTLTDGATVTWNANSGQVATLTLAGTGRTLTITNPVAGGFYTLRIIQDGTGSRTITTWPTNTRWPGGITPVLTTTAAAVDIVTLFYDGTNFNAVINYDFK